MMLVALAVGGRTGAVRAEPGDAAPSPADPPPISAQPGSPLRIDRPPPPAVDVDPAPDPYEGAPVNDDAIFWHVLFDQLEGRTNGARTLFRWSGGGWVGNDFNKLRLKTEGFVDERGRVEDGDQELLYQRPIPRVRYFDWQAGVRYDWDSGPGRVWGALGVEGLAPGFFDLGATLYVRGAGHVAGRIEGSYDLLLTNRLIVQPQFELNLYSRDDPARAVGAGVSDLDAGLRIRYEITRKFAPYVGVAYDGKFGETADIVRKEGGDVDDVRFVFGVRVWY